MIANWYADTLCKVHFDMHTPGGVEDVGRDFCPEAFARALVDSGAEAVCFFARCAYGWSYYPTRVGFPHPHLTRDLFGEGVEAMKRHGLRVLAYVAMCAVPAAETGACAPWLLRTAEGEEYHDPRDAARVHTCASAFLDQHLTPQLLELAQRYEIDGFFLDYG